LGRALPDHPPGHPRGPSGAAAGWRRGGPGGGQPGTGGEGHPARGEDRASPCGSTREGASRREGRLGRYR